MLNLKESLLEFLVVFRLQYLNEVHRFVWSSFEVFASLSLVHGPRLVCDVIVLVVVTKFLLVKLILFLISLIFDEDLGVHKAL